MSRVLQVNSFPIDEKFNWGKNFDYEMRFVRSFVEESTGLGLGEQSWTFCTHKSLHFILGHSIDCGIFVRRPVKHLLI